MTGSAGSKRYRAEHPELADELYRMQHRQLPDGWDSGLPAFPADRKGMATRNSSGLVLNAIARNVPWLIGGAADLAPSTKTRLTFDGAGDFEAGNYEGRNLHFGIREHAMGAILNGMALVKVRAFGSGFLIFSDYGRMPIRLAAIMEIPVIYVFTHDSIGVGEDGPTHQPIEQLASLRAIPGLVVLRPADANEVVEAWKVIMQLHHQPAAIILTRQDLPTLDRTKYAPASGLARGAYVLADAPGGKPEVLLMASGSEVSLCVAAHERLTAEGIRSRVISMPSWELFDDQDAAYRDSVLPPDVTARVSVELASVFGWAKYVGTKGQSIGMRSFGASAPLKDLQREFGFTVEQVVEAARKVSWDERRREGRRDAEGTATDTAGVDPRWPGAKSVLKFDDQARLRTILIRFTASVALIRVRFQSDILDKVSLGVSGRSCMLEQPYNDSPGSRSRRLSPTLGPRAGRCRWMRSFAQRPVGSTCAEDRSRRRRDRHVRDTRSGEDRRSASKRPGSATGLRLPTRSGGGDPHGKRGERWVARCH